MIEKIIEWIATSKPFEKFYEEAARKGSMDAFHKAHKDIMESFAGDVEKKAAELMTQELEKMLSIIDSRMIISFNDREKAVYIGGEKVVDPARLQNLKSEAEFFAESDLWSIIHETPKRLAEKAMFTDEGKLENLLLKGRIMLYLLDTQKRILDTLRSYSQKK